MPAPLDCLPAVLPVAPGPRQLALCLCLVCLLAAPGCASKTPPSEIMLQEMAKGRSLVIYPTAGGDDYWAREDGSASFYWSGWKIGKKYSVMALTPGTYYFTRAYSSSTTRELSHKKDYPDSRFGTVHVLQTPNAKTVETKEYNEITKSWETKEETEEIESYQIRRYRVIERSGQKPDYVATLEVGPNEILLVPGLACHIDFDREACQQIDEKVKHGPLMDFLDLTLGSVIKIAGLLLDPFATEHHFRDMNFICAVKGLDFALYPTDIADFKRWVEARDMPPGTYDRVQYRDLKLGPLFDEPHKTSPAKYRAYGALFSEDVYCYGTWHTFSGKEGWPWPGR